MNTVKDPTSQDKQLWYYAMLKYGAATITGKSELSRDISKIASPGSVMFS